MNVIQAYTHGSVPGMHLIRTGSTIRVCALDAGEELVGRCDRLLGIVQKLAEFSVLLCRCL